NTGNRNTGNCNTGNRNTGDCNTGYSNTGYRNTGNRNTGNRNTGFLNTNTPKVRIFNKKTDVKREDIVFPSFFFFDILSDDTNLYKSWRKSFSSATKKDVKLLLGLPNFDYKIFSEITGISKKMIQKKLEDD
ncbi:MAG: pentapeptide repeat-containing protein, partial [Firmicutes bacterium]|nr:pentapeptide repeat-containing protein [Bacillota bacterium]